MNDARMKILRWNQLQEYKHIIPDTVKFTLKLNEKIHGDLNPVTDIKTALNKIFAE